MRTRRSATYGVLLFGATIDRWREGLQGICRTKGR